MTTVRPDSYLTLHYRITTLDGEEFLSTFDMSPATLQMGGGQLADTLESVLLGLPAHERFVFELEPNDAFGQHNPRLVERIARSGLPADMELKENSVVEFTAPNGGSFAGFLRAANWPPPICKVAGLMSKVDRNSSPSRVVMR